MQLLLSTLLLGALVVPNFAWARDEVRLRILPSSKSQLSPDLQSTLLRALEASAKSEKATPIPKNVEEWTDCELPACFSDLQSLGATHALQVDVTFANESYSFHLELWEVESKRSLGSDSRECAICAAQDLVEDVALRTQELLKRSLRTKRTDLVASKPVLPSPEPQAVHSDGGQSLLPYAGIGLIVVGLGLGAVGTYYLIEDGQPKSEDNTRVRDTKKPGMALVASGVGALLGGVGLLTWHSVTLSTTVVIGPHPLILATLAWPSLALP